MPVNALILTGFGINCDHETARAFEMAGAKAYRVHLNDLAEDPERLERYQILAIPGGFSFGDDVASGRILANRLRYRLGGPLKEFVAAGKLAIGICNGFQVMVKMGLLPLFEGDFAQEVQYVELPDAIYEAGQRHFDEVHSGSHYYDESGADVHGTLEELFIDDAKHGS